MIVNWFFMLAQAMVDGLMALVPDWKVPDTLLHLDDSVSSMLTAASGLGAWVNFPVVSILVGIPLALWASGFAFRVGLWAWSKIPVIGSK